MKTLKPLIISGKEVLPLIEGGKGISVSTGQSAGAWAAAGAVGTFSGVYGDFYDENNKLVPLVFSGKTRKERSVELTSHAIKAAISQARIAHDISKGEGVIHMNVLWGITAIEQILCEVLAKTQNLVHGITGGAGMPFKMAEIAARYRVFYYPIISSARAFSLLWRKSYMNFKEWLGGVVYEDPWKAGGHNGISNSENPDIPEDPYPRVLALREIMNSYGLENVPIIMAGGVWFLRDWENWIDNEELGPIVFQLGTRPLLTVESPISKEWKQRLLTLQPEHIISNHFSPTGFYSLAVSNSFIKELQQRSSRQLSYSSEPTDDKTIPFVLNKLSNRTIYLSDEDSKKAHNWINNGFNKIMNSPDSTIMFLDEAKYNEIRTDQVNCAGCLSYCRFANWAENEEFTKLRSPDPRSYCIRKTLFNIAHSGSVEDNLMFAGRYAYLFAQDPFYSNNFIPTVQQLVDRILTGD
jgi:nitronate monooxygenase